MKNNIKNIKELVSAIGLLVILAFLMNPMGFYYSNMTLASIITILILLFIFFSVVVMKDKPADEREEKHQHLAGRSAFLAGTTVMIIGIIVQSISHQIDVWLVIALAVMIAVKLIATKHSEKNN